MPFRKSRSTVFDRAHVSAKNPSRTVHWTVRNGVPSRSKLSRLRRLQRTQEREQVRRVRRIQRLVIRKDRCWFSAVFANRSIDRLRAIVMHEAAGFFHDVRQAPQRRRPPHGQSRFTHPVWQEGNAARISRTHVMQQEIRVRAERDVAQRSDYASLSAIGGSQRNVLPCGEALDVADAASRALEHCLPGGCLRRGRRWWKWRE